MKTLPLEYLQQVLSSFSNDFPGKEVKSVRVTEYDTVKITYAVDCFILSYAEYAYSVGFKAVLQK